LAVVHSQSLKLKSQDIKN